MAAVVCAKLDFTLCTCHSTLANFLAQEGREIPLYAIALPDRPLNLLSSRGIRNRLPG